MRDERSTTHRIANSDFFSRLKRELRGMKLDVAAFEGADGQLSLEELFVYLASYPFFKDPLQQTLGLELLKWEDVFVVVASDIHSLYEPAAKRVWIDRSELEEKIAEIVAADAAVEPQEAWKLILTAVMTSGGEDAPKDDPFAEEALPEKFANEVYAVKLAKRARQFEVFAEVYARNAVVRAGEVHNALADHQATVAENAWRSAGEAAREAARAAIAAVKSGDVERAVREATQKSEAAMRRSAQSAQDALDAVNRIIELPTETAMEAAADREKREPLLDRISTCLSATDTAAARAERFAGYADTYIKMAAVKEGQALSGNVGQRALGFAETAAKAAAEAMMAVDEARAAASGALFSTVFTEGEKSRIDQGLRAAEQKAKNALEVAADAAAHTGEVVVHKNEL